MNSRKLGGLALLAFLPLTSCLFDSTPPDIRVAGGTIETTNGIVVTPDGKPAARVTGYLLDEDGWLSKIKSGESVVLDSFTTNDTGYFEIKKDTSTHASLLVNDAKSGILIRSISRHLIESEYRNKIVLREHASYRGQVSDTEAGARQVYLAGTPYTGLVTESGTFFIDNVPPDHYTVVVRRVGPDQKEEFVPAGEITLVKQDSVAPPDTLKPDTTKTLLVDDFEDEDNRTKLGPLLGGGYWDAYSDEYVGGNSRLIQPVNAAPTNFSSAMDSGAGGSGKSLKVMYQLGNLHGDEKPYPYVFVEANLGLAENSSYTHYNLSNMDTVTFWAKGTGGLVVELVQNQIAIPLNVTADDSIALTPNWQLYKIAVSGFKVGVSIFPDDPAQFKQQLIDSRLPAYSQKPTTWAEMGGMVRTIRFLGTDGDAFWLDDISLHGLALDDLLK